MYTVQWGCWLLAPSAWVAGLGMGTSTARGARLPVPNCSYAAEQEPARSSPIHPIARLSGSEQLRRSTAKILLALLYVKIQKMKKHYPVCVKPTAKLVFKDRFAKGGPTCRRQVVNPRHQTSQGRGWIFQDQICLFHCHHNKNCKYIL